MSNEEDGRGGGNVLRTGRLESTYKIGQVQEGEKERNGLLGNTLEDIHRERILAVSPRRRA